MKNFRIWFFSILPIRFVSNLRHRCENWQTYLGEKGGRVLFCGVCGKILDQEWNK
jgi:hypothetical protein